MWAARAVAGGAGIVALIAGSPLPVYGAGRDVPTPTVRVANVVAVQSPVGAVTTIVPIVLDRPATATVTVHWLTGAPSTDYPAIAGHDYTAAQGTVTFAPGEAQHDVKVKLHKGEVTTPWKDLDVSVDQVTGAAGVNASGLVRIVGPTPGDMLAGSAVVFVPEAAARGKGYTATVTFVLSERLAQDVNASFSEHAENDGTMNTNEFFAAKSGRFHIAAGKLTGTARFRLLRPPDHGASHGISVVLSDVSGLPGSAAPAYVWLRDTL